MDLGLKDKVVIVSGGGSGIGNAIVHGLIHEGAFPVIVDRNKSNLLEISRILTKNNNCHLIIQAELTEESECKRIVKETVDTFDRIDILVNNAGTNDGVGLENGSPNAFVHSLQSNLIHYYNLAHFALPYLKKTKGNILNISSKVGITGQGGTSGYAASNAARNGLTREWAVELLPYGIRVNAVVPAEVQTQQYDKWIQTFPNPDQKLNEITHKIPLEQRRTTADEIANTALFLMSEKSSHTTGQLVFPDGGYVHLDRAINLS